MGAAGHTRSRGSARPEYNRGTRCGISRTCRLWSQFDYEPRLSFARIPLTRCSLQLSALVGHYGQFGQHLDEETRRPVAMDTSLILELLSAKPVNIDSCIYCIHLQGL